MIPLAFNKLHSKNMNNKDSADYHGKVHKIAIRKMQNTGGGGNVYIH